MNTTEFLARARDAAMVPDNDEDWTDAKWLQCGSEALRERYTQTMPNMRSGYWLHRTTTTATAGLNEYRIPARAIAQGLEKLEVSSDGLRWRKLNPLSDGSAGEYDTSPGEANWFSLEADYVVIYPSPSAGLYIRFSYYLRPNRLVALSAVGVVVSTPTSTSIRVSGGNPTSLLGASGTVDVINTSGTNEVAVVALPFSSIALVSGSTYDITVPVGTSLSRLAAGQVLRVPDTTDYVPLPVELHESLVNRVAASYLLEHGDAEQAENLAGKSENAIKRFQDTAQPRVHAQPYRVKSGKNTYLRRRYG